MAIAAALTRKLLYDEFDLSGEHNNLTLKLSQDAKEKTVYGDGSIARALGIKGFNINHSGYFKAGTGMIDTVLQGNLGTAGKILTMLPTGTDGEQAYCSKGVTLNYEMAGKIGDMFAVKGETKSEGTLLVRGNLMATGAKTTTGHGTARELGAVSATQYLYGILHGTAITGESVSCVVKIQSDTAENFPSPVDRITFTTLSDSGGVSKQWATPVAGAITDTWWRVNWAITGSGSFTIWAIIGIQ